jgi:MipA family protein
MGMMVVCSRRGFPRSKSTVGFRGRALAYALALVCASAAASSDPLSGIAAPGGVAIGAMSRAERSPYRGAGMRYDFMPLYLYEGERFYLHSHNVGVKFGASEARRFDVFLRRRLEGHPVDDIPPALAGMAQREPGIGAGLSGQLGGPWGIAFVEAVHDLSASKGGELRLGYRYPYRAGRWWLRPYATLSLRNAQLNDYYYGVRPEEANASRAAYHVDGGVMGEVGIFAVYQLSRRWRVLAGANAARLPDTITESPIVQHRTLHNLQVGALYDLSPDREAWPEHGRPLIARAFYGASSECNVMQIAELRCTSTHTQDKTAVVGFELGTPFLDRLNGWPIDLAGFIGLIQHREQGFQNDFWQVNAYLKTYFYGFPWDAKLRTRLGLGVGLSYAKEVPFTEQRDQSARGRATSKLLNTFDPTADISVGDLLGIKRMRETYAGVGVSHRSGIFGTSQLLGNVNGGSNYIYGYVETSFR